MPSYAQVPVENHPTSVCLSVNNAAAYQCVVQLADIISGSSYCIWTTINDKISSYYKQEARATICRSRSTQSPDKKKTKQISVQNINEDTVLIETRNVDKR